MQQVPYCGLINTVLEAAVKKIQQSRRPGAPDLWVLVFEGTQCRVFFFILLYGVGNPGHRASSDFILIGNDPKEE